MMTRPISRILVPTDFSPASEQALEYAAMLAERFGATVHLLHVIDSPMASAGAGPELYLGAAPSLRDNLIDRAADRLARSVARPDADRIHLTSEVRIGAAAETIRAVARERACELIVMGTHGRTGLAHLLLGRVTEAVVRQAPCPVLAVRARAPVLPEAVRDERFIGEAAPTG